MEEEVIEDYTSSLADLTFNSKPLINMLTMLAEDNAQYSEQIVQVIEAHMQKVPADRKLPALYLSDSIMKNVRQSNYPQFFAKNIVNSFVGVFEKVDEKKRQAMFKLRQTWADIFPAKKLYALDLRVNQIDPAWPVTPPPAEKNVANIHINPRFLMKKEQEEARQEEARQNEIRKEEARQNEIRKEEARQEDKEAVMRQQLLSKQQELLRLQQQRVELELAEARSRLQQQAKQLHEQETTLPITPNVQLLRMPEIESISVVNHFPPQAQVAPHPVATPLTIPTTTRETQQDPRLVHDPRLANRDTRSSAQPQWQTAVVHPAVQVKPQVHIPPPQIQPPRVQPPPVEYIIPVNASPSVSTTKSDSSLSDKESEKAKKSPAKLAEKSNKQSVVATKKAGGNVMKVDPKTNVAVKKDDKHINSSANKTVESVRKASSSASSSSEKRTTRADSRTRSTRSHAGDRSKEKAIIRDPRKDAKAKPIADAARPRSRSPRAIRLPPEHAHRRYRSNRGSFDGDRCRHSHEDSPTEKTDPISSRLAEKHKLGRIRGRLLESSVQGTGPRKSKTEGAKTDGSWHKTVIDVDAGPVAKRVKQDVAPPKDEIHDPLPDDLADLFGSEDKDYRQMGPPVTPKLDMRAARAARESVDSVLPSPKQEEWARFKQSRPEDFPFAQPRSSSMDIDIRCRDVDLRDPLMSPPGVQLRRGGGYHPKRLSQDHDLVIPKQLRLDHAENVLRQAEEQLKRGTLSREDHQDLKTQLDRLYILQKIEQDGRNRRAEMEENRPPDGSPRGGFFDDRFGGPRRGRMDESMGSPGRMGSPGHFPERSNSPHFDTDERCPNRESFVPKPRMESALADAEDMRLPQAQERHSNNGPGFQVPPMGFRPFPGQDNRMGPQAQPMHPHFRPQHPGTPYVKSEFSFTDHPWYDTDRHSVFEHDKRWMMRVRQRFGSRKSSEVVIDGKCFQMVMHNKPRNIRIGDTEVQVRVDMVARCVFVGPTLCYWMGTPEVTETINGHPRRIHFRGPIKRLWIDGHEYELWMDAPPENVVIAGVEYSVRIDGKREEILVNDAVICKLTEHPQTVNIGSNKHEIHFNQPSKQILIDNKLCELNFSGKFPVAIINGKAHGIRFDGGPRDIIVNGMPWKVDVDKPRIARLSGPRPYLIALGGPGHEVIIDDQWHVVKFNGPEVFFTHGYRKFRVQLKGSAPEVKILGEVITPEQAIKIYGPKPIQPTPPGPMEPVVNNAGFRPRREPIPQQVNEGFGGPVERQPFPLPQLPQQRDESSFQGRRNNSVPSLLDLDVKGVKKEPHRDGLPPGGPQFNIGPRPQQMVPSLFNGPRGLFPNTRPNMGMRGGDGILGAAPGSMDQPARMMNMPLNQNMPAGMMPGSGGMQSMLGGQQQPMMGSQQQQQSMMGPQQQSMMGPQQQQSMMGPQQQQQQSMMGPQQQQQSMMGPQQQQQSMMGPQQQQQSMMGPQQQQNINPMPAAALLAGAIQGIMTQGVTPGQMQLLSGMNYMQQQQNQQQQQQLQMMQSQGLPPPQLQPMNKQVDVDDLLSKLMMAGIINKDEPKPETKESSAESQAESQAESNAERKTESKKDGKNDGKSDNKSDKAEKDKKPEVKKNVKKEPEIKFDDVPDVSDFDIQKMKECYNGVIQRLYTGVQCSSCGTRFVATDTDQYREHLDWHFRQNRKEKDDYKQAKSRCWYYAAADWVQFEEIGDTEQHSSSNYFETMMQLAQEQQGFGNLPGQAELISCPAALGNERDDVCAICGDPFEQFWDEDQEAWHLKDAIRVQGETYHPVCYEDAKESGLGDGSVTPDAQQLVEQAEQLVEPPDPITNPLAYLTMLNQQSKKLSLDSGVAVATTAAAIIATVAGTITTAATTTVSVKSEPKSPLEMGVTASGVTIVSSGQTIPVTTSVQGKSSVKCEDIPTTTTCVSQSSSTGSTTTTATTSGEATTEQTDDTGTDAKTQSTDVSPS